MTREEAREYLINISYQIGTIGIEYLTCRDGDKMRQAIEVLALEEPHWIQCSERLPEKEGWYITTVESEKTRKRRIENDLFAVDIALSHGHTPNKFCKDGYRQRTVAWMPFPEPYTERRTNE